MTNATQRATLEKIVRDYEAVPAQGNSPAEMIARTEYMLAKRMLAEDECSRIQKGRADAQDLPQITALGLRLQKARERRGINAKLMAERIGVSLETVHRLESGDASLNIATLYRALRILGLKQDFYTLAADKPMQRKSLLIQSIADAKVRTRCQKDEGEH